MYAYVKLFQALCEELTKKAATLAVENENLKKVRTIPYFISFYRGTFIVFPFFILIYLPYWMFYLKIHIFPHFLTFLTKRRKIWL